MWCLLERGTICHCPVAASAEVPSSILALKLLHLPQHLAPGLLSTPQH